MATVTFSKAPEQMAVIAVPSVEVVLGDQVRIPAGITDLASFWTWAESDSFPETGRVDYLDGEIWVDLSMEQFYTHNQVKQEISQVLGVLAKSCGTGRFVPDGMRFRHLEAEISTEPDGMFVTYQSMQSGYAVRAAGAFGGYTAMEGSPEMVLEVLSDSSEEKDTERLPEAYHRAGIAEFWRVDVRGEQVLFEIFRHALDGYQPTIGEDGWWRSDVFGRWFRLVQGADPLGDPLFTSEHHE